MEKIPKEELIVSGDPIITGMNASHFESS